MCLLLLRRDNNVFASQVKAICFGTSKTFTRNCYYPVLVVVSCLSCDSMMLSSLNEVENRMDAFPQVEQNFWWSFHGWIFMQNSFWHFWCQLRNIIKASNKSHPKPGDTRFLIYERKHWGRSQIYVCLTQQNIYFLLFSGGSMLFISFFHEGT